LSQNSVVLCGGGFRKREVPDANESRLCWFGRTKIS
jgi:hypothetical protein